MENKKEDKKAVKVVWVDEDTHKNLKIRAAKEGTSIGELVKKLAKKEK